MVEWQTRKIKDLVSESSWGFESPLPQNHHLLARVFWIMQSSNDYEPHPHYISDAAGKRLAVILSLDDYEALLAIVEDHNDAIAFNQAVEENTDFQNLDDVLDDIATT